MIAWHRREGAPWPIGVSWRAEDQTVNFALYSKHATAVTLLLYGRHDVLRPRHTVVFDPSVRPGSSSRSRHWKCSAPQATSHTIAASVVRPETPPAGP